MNVRTKRNGCSIERMGLVQIQHQFTHLCDDISTLKAWLNDVALPSKPLVKLLSGLMDLNWFKTSVIALGNISESRFTVGEVIRICLNDGTKFTGTCLKIKQKAPWVSYHVKTSDGSCIVGNVSIGQHQSRWL
ncbi:MAG: hypothetical protein ACTS4T_01485 [Candidatus Hodgkinia cicadicola]